MSSLSEIIRLKVVDEIIRFTVRACDEEEVSHRMTNFTIFGKCFFDEVDWEVEHKQRNTTQNDAETRKNVYYEEKKLQRQRLTVSLSPFISSLHFVAVKTLNAQSTATPDSSWNEMNGGDIIRSY